MSRCHREIARIIWLRNNLELGGLPYNACPACLYRVCAIFAQLEGLKIYCATGINENSAVAHHTCRHLIYSSPAFFFLEQFSAELFKTCSLSLRFQIYCYFLASDFLK